VSYAQPSDMQLRYSNRDLVALTDPVNNTTLNTATLQTFLNDASDEMDMYFEARFALPLLDPPAVLTPMCCEIAMYHLQALRPVHDIEDAKNKYESRIAQLKEVRDGKLTLGLSADSQEPPDPSSPAVIVEQNVQNDPCVPQRVFSRGTLKGF
jgi:phage gp36-like protein